MSNEQIEPGTKGVELNLPATVDLGAEIEGMTGRQLRMRMVTIAPGVGWREDRNTTHWLENRGSIPAVEISVDIVRHG